MRSGSDFAPPAEMLQKEFYLPPFHERSSCGLRSTRYVIVVARQ
jgi:hypothetical protein